MLVDELEQCGVEVYFVNDGIWTFNKDDYFKLTIMATYAEQESRKTSERVFSGQAVARANGIHFGSGNILGYDIMKGESSKDTTYIINEEQARTVRKIYELALCGYGVRKIKKYLEENGYRTSEGKSTWYIASIERILRRRTYIGEYEYFQSVTINPLTHERIIQKDKSKRVVKRGKFPPIISEELWYQVQREIDSRTNQFFSVDNNQMVVRGQQNSKDLYRCKLRCGCGRKFRQDFGRIKGSGTYRCYNVIEDGSIGKSVERSQMLNDKCCINGIIDWKLDLLTLKVFEYFSLDNKMICEELMEIAKRVILSHNNIDTEKLQIATDKLERQKEHLLEAFIEELISKDTYRSKRKYIENELREKRKEIEIMKTEVMDAAENNSVLNKIQEYIEDNTCKVDSFKVPDVFVDSYVEKIRALPDNTFEYYIRGCDSEIAFEFEVDYSTARKYANQRGRRVIKKQWEKPIRVRVYGRNCSG